MAKNNIKIPETSRIKVYWEDTPENYTKEAKNRVHAYFTNKYGVNKKNVNVVFRPIKVDDKGNKIDMCQAGIDNILDINYQRSLFKEWLQRENKVVDFNRLIALDDKVNSALNIEEVSSRNRKWSLKWLEINNFLCFGQDNYVDMEGLKGITLVTSSPANAGGKTTFSMEAVRYLLFGTTSKNDRNEEIFNTYSNVDEVVVRGGIVIDNDEFIIERRLTRKLKKDSTYSVNGTAEYYQLMPDGSERDLKGEDSKDTLKIIKESIGNESDFEIIISANSKNLEDLIETKPTERGKLLTRFIGLEPIEEKETKAREMYNEFAKKMLSNQYNVIQLESEIETHLENIKTNTDNLVILNDDLLTTKTEIEQQTTKKEGLISRKHNIDDEIIKMNPDSLTTDIDNHTSKGIAANGRIKEINDKLVEMGEIVFDENIYQATITEDKNLSISKANNENKVKQLNRSINDLKSSEICPTCKRPLEGVDNTETIANYASQIDELSSIISQQGERLLEVEDELNSFNVTRKLVNEKNQLELERDRLSVEMDSLRNKIKEKKNKLKEYQLNVEFIELNKQLDIDISFIQTKIQTLQYHKDELNRDIQNLEMDTKNNENYIATKKEIIEKIKKEDDIEKIFKIYIEMVGKKGISKLVLRSVIPIINSELHRLLDDVVEFEIELYMNDKNDIEFLLINGGVEKKLKSASGLEKFASSIALRAVLGRVSYLPKPNFLQFDEIFGPVASENLDNMRALFAKILEWYDTIMLISHVDVVKDWADHIVTIKKENHISKISTN